MLLTTTFVVGGCCLVLCESQGFYIFLKIDIKNLANFQPPKKREKSVQFTLYKPKISNVFPIFFFKEKTTRFVGRKTLLGVVWPKWMFNIHFHPFDCCLVVLFVGFGRLFRVHPKWRFFAKQLTKNRTTKWPKKCCFLVLVAKSIFVCFQVMLPLAWWPKWMFNIFIHLLGCWVLCYWAWEIV